jgi:hypothetical protein
MSSKDDCLLGCCAVKYGRCFPTFQKCVLPPLSGRCHRPDDGGSKHHCYVGKPRPNHTAQHPRRRSSSYSPPWEPEISHKCQVFENEVLWKIFLSKTHVRSLQFSIFLLHSEEHNLYRLLRIVRFVKWGHYMGWMSSSNGEARNAYRILTAKRSGRQPLGRPRRRWEDNIKMGLL